MKKFFAILLMSVALVALLSNHNQNSAAGNSDVFWDENVVYNYGCNAHFSALSTAKTDRFMLLAGKAVETAGKEVATAGQTMGRGVEKAGKSVASAMRNLGRGVEKATKEVEKTINPNCPLD